MSLLARIPIRLRLTLVFGAAMAVVLAATGVFLYFRLGSELENTIDDSLRSRADDVAALVRQADTGLREGGGSRLTEQGESFAQVLDLDGRVVDTTPQLGGRPLLSRSELARAAAGPITLDRAPVPGIENESRLLAAPVRAEKRQLVVVVGSSLEGREEALSGLRTQLLVGGPLVLLAASLLAYVLAAAALRPVDAMRREAAAISASEPGRRLPVPPARDEVARLGETLNEMLARLEAALERERTFVADASHELRTPLALIRTELELALRRPRSGEELERAVRSAAEETQVLAQLTEDLLVLARSDQELLPIRRAPVPVATVFSGVVERFASRSGQQGRRLETSARGGLAVTGDQLRLEQALGNLVENALRYGGGTVSLDAVERDDAIELHVRDEGPGFPPAFLPRAFERFSRADEARSRGGAGLGLAIVEMIARAHGGSAHAANVDGGGADAWLSIPAK